MVHHDIEIFIKESTATSPTKARRQLWPRRSNDNDVMEITLPTEATTSIERGLEVLNDDEIILVFSHLSPLELLRAALASHRLKRVASVVLPLPMNGYFFHPPPPAYSGEKRPAVFDPVDRSSPRLSIDFV